MSLTLVVAWAAVVIPVALFLIAKLVGFGVSTPNADRASSLREPDNREWRDEVQLLREMILQLRVELAEGRRLSAVREAELRRMLGGPRARVMLEELRDDLTETRRLAATRESDLRTMLGASRSRLHLVEQSLHEMATEVEESRLGAVN